MDGRQHGTTFTLERVVPRHGLTVAQEGARRVVQLEIALPKLCAARDVELDVAPFCADIWAPGYARLVVRLPFRGDVSSTRAKFDRRRRRLLVRIPECGEGFARSTLCDLIAALTEALPNASSAQADALRRLESAVARRRREIESATTVPLSPTSVMAVDLAALPLLPPLPPRRPPPSRRFIKTAHADSVEGVVKIIAGGNRENDDGGFVNGPAHVARFHSPWVLTLHPDRDALVIVDQENSALRLLDFVTGSVSNISGGLGNGFANSTEERNARYFFPAGCAFHRPFGAFVLADRFNHRVRRVALAQDGTANASTFAGAGPAGWADDPAATASFHDPWGVAVDDDGRVYVSEHKNGTIRVIADGMVTTLASGFAKPMGLTIGPDGAILLIDHEHHCIKRVTKAGEVSLVAGDGTQGFRDGPASSARFCHPTDVAVASDGTIYVADWLNHRVRFIADGVVGTLAGAGLRSTQEGVGTDAAVRCPLGLCLDEPSGLLYVTTGRGSHRILSVTVKSRAHRRRLRIYPILQTWALKQKELAELALLPQHEAKKEAQAHAALRLLLECPIADVVVLVLEYAF